MDAASAKTMNLQTWFRVERPAKEQALVPWTQKDYGAVGIEEQRARMDAWLSDFKAMVPGTPRGAFLLGPSGTGKTMCATGALLAAGFVIVERSALSHRTKKALEEDVVRTAMVGPPNALLMEDVDTIAAGQGGLDVITRLINPLRGLNRPITAKDRERAASLWTIPIVCVANSCVTRGISDLASDCLLLNFGRLPESAMISLAWNVLVKEKACVSQAAAANIIRLAGGDARCLVQSLEYYVRTGGKSGKTDKDSTTSEICARVFEARPNVAEASTVAGKDPLSSCHMLQENYVLRDVTMDAVEKVAASMSDADLFVGEDAWGPLIRYVCVFTAGAVSVYAAPSRGPPLIPGTSWSKESYLATRVKQAARARDLMRERSVGDAETCRFLASLMRSLSDAGRYDEACELARAYKMGAKDIDVLVKADRPDALKQRHKSAYKRLLPP